MRPANAVSWNLAEGSLLGGQPPYRCERLDLEFEVRNVAAIPFPGVPVRVTWKAAAGHVFAACGMPMGIRLRRFVKM